ncbi:Hydrolase (HAD superfamily), YqeK [Candidatus Phytoplasma phoenicium]|uniref:bis(5'-nucleosyl)-tetraphosphatase (symmetrical) n=2 Tax=Candidatus Phytoplasma phoenicium TaxID=198422 RepID=A0A0L0MK57_9MOLU|nr:Hydrolase (HAD superfamily), YqeK [Candidatus Phytoplasma phoenicium]
MRLNHILGVYRKSIQLARLHKVNTMKAQISALFHDYTKNESLDFHLALLKPQIINQYKHIPFVYHAFSAAELLKKEFGITDVIILNAIRKHVIGHLKMNKLDKIIFLSDKLENSRDFPQISYFRQLSLENLDKAIYKVLESNLHYYKNKHNKVCVEQLIIFKFFQQKLRY